MTDRPLATYDDATLENALRALAPSIDWPTAAPLAPSGAPAGPDVATRVRVRLTSGERPRTATPRTTTPWWRPRARSWRRSLVLAVIALLALALVAGAAGLGLPGLRFLFGQPPASALPSAIASSAPGSSAGATATVPPIPGMRLNLGRQVQLDEVEALTGHPLRLPTDARLGPPDSVWVDQSKGGQVAYVWAADADLPETSERGVGLVLMRFPGTVENEFYEKVIGQGTTLAMVDVAGHDGWWISGDMHFFFYERPGSGFVDDGRRWVGDALVWNDGTATYRIESALGREATIALAESID
jgi:hypothetical protein